MCGKHQYFQKPAIYHIFIHPILPPRSSEQQIWFSHVHFTRFVRMRHGRVSGLGSKPHWTKRVLLSEQTCSESLRLWSDRCFGTESEWPWTSHQVPVEIGTSVNQPRTALHRHQMTERTLRKVMFTYSVFYLWWVHPDPFPAHSGSQRSNLGVHMAM